MTQNTALTEFTLKLYARCQQSGEHVEIDIKPSDINSSVSDCELCGSHGRIYIDFPCPQCKSYHEVELNEW